MTDLAASTASEKLGIPTFSPQLSYDLLPITGTEPQTVYVDHFQTIDDQGRVQHHIGFALQPYGKFFTHGIQWTAIAGKDRTYAMFITYVFQSSEIREILCPTLHYSDAYQPTRDPQPSPAGAEPLPPRQQNMCVPWGKATYWFDVDVQLLKGDHLKLLVDPIIVVTPQ